MLYGSIELSNGTPEAIQFVSRFIHQDTVTWLLACYDYPDTILAVLRFHMVLLCAERCMSKPLKVNSFTNMPNRSCKR
jgi:hypothetical protein